MEITMEEYTRRLQKHDWTYEYSDDFRVFSAGSEQRKVLYRMQQDLDPNYEVWNKHAPEMFRREVNE